MSNKVSVELSMNTTGYQEGINSAIDSTKKYETETRKVADAQVNLMKEFKASRRAAQNLAAGFVQLDDSVKNSAFGRDMANQLNEASEKAAYFINLQGDIRDGLNTLASETAALDLLTTGISAIGGVASASAGAIALFTGNEEDAQRAVVLFTTAQSLLNTVVSTYNGIKTIQNALLVKGITGTTGSTAATNANTVATKAGAAAQALFNKIAMANPYVLLATAIIGVTAAIATFVAFSGESKEAQEEDNKAKERAKEINDAYYDTYNNNLSETLGNYTKLQVEWNNLKSASEKNKWIKDNADAFHNLGYEITDTGSAEKFFVDNEAKVIASFVARAEAAAIAAKQVEIFNQALRDIPKPGDIKSAEWFLNQGLSIDGREDKNKGIGRFEYKYEVTEEDSKKVTQKRLAEARKSSKQLGKLQVDAEKRANKRAAEVGVKTYTQTREKLLKPKHGSSNTDEILNKNSLAYAEKELKDLQQQLNEIDITDLKAVKHLQEEIERAKKEVSKRKIALGLEVETKIVKGSSGWWDKQIKDLEEAQKKLAEGSQEWFNIDDKIKELEDTRKLLTEGVTIEGNTKIGRALRGDFEHSMQGYSDAISALQDKLQNIDWSTPEGAKQFDEYVTKIQQFKEELSNLTELWETAMMTPAEKAKKNLEDTVNSINRIGNAVNATGELFNALGEATDSKELKIAGIVAQAVATVALSFAEALRTAKHWTEWLAFGVTGLTTMVSMISSIKQATAGSYAEGGIVGGHSYTGDKLLARVNSGEMVLNNRQQRNLFNLLDTGLMPQRGVTNIQVTGVVRGTDLLLVQKNTNKVRAKAGSKIYF